MWLLLLFVVLVTALPPHTCTDQNVADCMLGYMDTNSDGAISSSEWNHFSLYHECALLITRVAGSTMISECDADKDGVLTIADISHRRSCVAWAMQEDICDLCQQCATLMGTK